MGATFTRQLGRSGIQVSAMGQAQPEMAQEARGDSRDSHQRWPDVGAGCVSLALGAERENDPHSRLQDRGPSGGERCCHAVRAAERLADARNRHTAGALGQRRVRNTLQISAAGYYDFSTLTVLRVSGSNPLRRPKSQKKKG